MFLLLAAATVAIVSLVYSSGFQSKGTLGTAAGAAPTTGEAPVDEPLAGAAAGGGGADGIIPPSE